SNWPRETDSLGRCDGRDEEARQVVKSRRPHTEAHFIGEAGHSTDQVDGSAGKADEDRICRLRADAAPLPRQIPGNDAVDARAPFRITPLPAPTLALRDQVDRSIYVEQYLIQFYLAAELVRAAPAA